MATTTTTTDAGVYTGAVPEDHIKTIAASPNPPSRPAKPDFGFDSLFGLAASLIAAPLYLYATLKGKFKVWDDVLSALPDSTFADHPAIDVGCGRGMVLLKLAQRKKRIAEAAGKGPDSIPLAYGIDIFSTSDQTGNAPEATYKNALAMDVVPYTVLHTASFTETFPFKDNTFSLLTSSLAIHNANREGRLDAVREMARLCTPGGTVIIIDLYGFFKDHKSVLVDELGWKDVDVSVVSWKMLFGVLPCQILKATKPTQ